MLLNIIIFLLGLSVLIMAHELGHFLTAKLFNVYCYEFALGMGPIIISKKGKETRFSIRAFPIGGFVNMAGENMDDNPSDTEEKEDTVSKDVIEMEDSKLSELPKNTVDNDDSELNIPFERTINGIAPWKRFIVMISGVLMNFIIAYIFFFCFLMSIGVSMNIPQVDVLKTIDEKETPFYQIGITNDDVFQAVQSTFYIDGREIFIGEEVKINNYDDINEHVSIPEKVLEIIYNDNSLSPTINNKTKTYTFETFIQKMKVYTTKDGADHKYEPERSIYNLSIEQREIKEGETTVVRYNPNEGKYQYWGITIQVRDAKIGESLKNSAELEYENGILIFQAVGKLFTKEGFENVGGVVKMYEYSSQYQAYGLDYYLAFLGLISVNLGVMNLLPIPALDGSHLLIIIAEGVTRKKIPTRAKAIINFIGFVFLMGLMIVITCKDIIGLF